MKPIATFRHRDAFVSLKRSFLGHYLLQHSTDSGTTSAAINDRREAITCFSSAVSRILNDHTKDG